MNGNPTAAQKRFHQWCRDRGCIITLWANPSIHHIKGSRMKLKGCKNPGEWYVLPLNANYHQRMPYAIHNNKREFELATEGTEKSHWINLISIYEAEHGEKPMPEHEYQIIVDRA